MNTQINVDQPLIQPSSSTGCKASSLTSQFACPNLVLRGEDGLNYGITDVMSPWSAAVAEPGKEA